jgi:hypothetical protein
MIRSKHSAKPQAVFTGERLLVGAFYISTQVGGWTDVITGLHIPGPKVRVRQDTREPLEITELPRPVQLPHWKTERVLDKESRLYVDREVPFDRHDESSYHEGLQMALDCGIIERLDDERVRRVYPDAWAERQEHYVFSRDVVTKGAKTLKELLEEAELVEIARRDVQARAEEAGEKSVLTRTAEEEAEEESVPTRTRIPR